MLIQKIQQGDTEAIEKAGKSRNLIFVPYLRHQKDKDPRRAGPGVSPIVPAAIALARLGETQELQECWCRAITDDPKRGLTPWTQELESVGGWFSIQALEKLLNPAGLVHWHKPTKEEKNSDTAVEALHVSALKALLKVVPNAPLNYTPLEAQLHSQDLIRTWQDWIAAHKDELSKLEPTGESVDFSPQACKNGKPVKKH